MSDSKDSNYISVWNWMFLMIVPAIPLIGWLVVLVLAFTGDNQTRKNYYRAILAWILVFSVILVFLITFSSAWPDFSWSAISKHIHDWRTRHH